MSMTGRMIDEMRERADAGDKNAQETLSAVGLWETEEEAEARREAEYHWSDPYADETGEEWN